MQHSDAGSPGRTKSKPLALSMLAALGIVYGDLGTSPLYTMQTVLESLGGHLSTNAVLGVLSLIVWSLIVVVALKYCLFVMRADNRGEGGILALTALVTGTVAGDQQSDNGDAPRRTGVHVAVLLAFGLFGGAMLYGDGILTPAISVLSAVEGVKVATPALSHYVLPAAVAILLGLFLLQPLGTARIGALFGPVMLLWFIIIGVLGALAIGRHPVVLEAVDPRHAIGFLARHHWQSLAVLGGVFLCLTGAEALYADMGHIGRLPVRVAWFAIVLPALLLCYAGQSASLIGLDTLPPNPFYGILPPGLGKWAVWAMVVLATCATIIASQAIITGVFSMTRQAIQLGWFPGLNIRQTSDQEYGQIYVPSVNWVMMVLTLAVAVGFGSSDRLAGAYGMAVSTTMLLTTCLLYSYLRRIARWPLLAVVPAVTLFLLVDLGFLCANLLKVAQGGFLPLLAGALMFGVMNSWRKGVASLRARSGERVMSPQHFLDRLADGKVPRVPGSAVFLTPLHEPIPPLIVDHVSQFGALYEQVLTLTVSFAEVPRVPIEERVTLTRYEGGVWHAVARYGFVEIPTLQAAVGIAHEQGCPVDPAQAMFVGARDEVAPHGEPHKRRLSGWRQRLFGIMYRNAVHLVDRFDLPADRYVQIGRKIAL